MPLFSKGIQENEWKGEMEYEVEIDDKFVRNQLYALCQKRNENRDKNISKSIPPCKIKNKCCKIKSELCTLDWGGCTRLIGNCMLGEEINSKWIDTLDNSSLKLCLHSSVNIDWLLYLSQKRYRDHSSHQLFVGVLGWFLLECILRKPGNDSGIIETSQSLKQWISNRLNLTEDELDIAWWIASLFHDHAYPLAHMLQVTPSFIKDNDGLLLEKTWNLLGFKDKVHSSQLIFEKLYSFKFLEELYEAAKTTNEDRRKEIYKILKQRLTPEFFDDSEFDKNFDEGWYDHGILAAANLASLTRVNEIEVSNILRQAVRAIAIHNGGLYPERVDIKKDPLAFLLILCDECQEWGRRVVVVDEAKPESRSIKLRGLIKKEADNYMIDNSLTIVFEYTDASFLNKTGWSYPLFVNSKRNAFKRLHISDDFPIKQINFHVWIPHETHLTLSST
jgi:hypothetical protein